MMNTQAGFIGKILFFSTIISISIKYGGQLIPLAPTNSIALTIVLLPSLVVALTLSWRLRSAQWQSQSQRQ